MIAAYLWIPFVFSSEMMNCHKCALYRHRFNSVYSLQLYILETKSQPYKHSAIYSLYFHTRH